jgi:Putative prokaryotic signal transducing protein
MMDDENLDDAFEDKPEELPSKKPDETTHLVTVARARNMKEARAMRSILESAEITAFIGSEGTAPTLPGEAVGPGVPILVPEDMAIEAEELLAEAAMSHDDRIDDGGLDDEEWDEEEDEDEEGVPDNEFDEFGDDDDEDDDDEFGDLDEEDNDLF